MEKIISDLILIVGGIFATAFSAIVVYHYKKKADCFTVLKNTSYSNNNDIHIIKKFLAIQSRMIDDSTKKNHPNEALELQSLAKEMFDE